MFFTFCLTLFKIPIKSAILKSVSPLILQICFFAASAKNSSGIPFAPVISTPKLNNLSTLSASTPLAPCKTNGVFGITFSISSKISNLNFASPPNL